MTSADQTFVLAMRYLDDAVMQRRSADHFSGEHRETLARRADELGRTAFELAVLGVEALARR